MERQGDETHVSEEEASGGTQPHIVRYILGISLLLVTALMSLIWIIGSVSRRHPVMLLTCNNPAVRIR